MSPRPWLTLTLLITLGAACSGTGDADEADSADLGADDTGMVDGNAATSEGGMARDSIPMEITVTTTGGQANNNGTYTARGNGITCQHDPSAQAGTTSAEWRVVYAPADTASQIGLLDLQVGKTTNDTTGVLILTLAAGTMESAGVVIPARYMVGTYPSGVILGSGAVTVRREGEGARFTVNAVDGASTTRIAANITCARLGSVDG